MGWGGFLDKLMGKLPIQSRKERWKNKLDALEKERQEILKGVCDEKKSLRLISIDNNIAYIVQLLKNSASDS
jgi:hypothetical protein